MKMKIFSILICAILILTLLPATVISEENNIKKMTKISNDGLYKSYPLINNFQVINNRKNFIANEEPDDEKNGRGDELDQKQTETDGSGFRVSSEVWIAQGFTPTLNTLTRVKLRIFKHGNPPSDENFIVSIRDGLDNLSDLTVISKNAIDIPQDYWVEFDFDDVRVTPGQKYYIVCHTDNVDENNAYCWLYGINDPYKGGDGWGGVFGLFWILLDDPPERPNCDLCFKTFGLNKQSKNIVLSNMVFTGLQERFPLFQKFLHILYL